ncbi:hypothetical protein BDZ97DRAFT_2065432 [Flammula alnicola]|nr:hypothetical protein BDZ97DRAFT_2065432 [Flammula alnicola]
MLSQSQALAITQNDKTKTMGRPAPLSSRVLPRWLQPNSKAGRMGKRCGTAGGGSGGQTGGGSSGQTMVAVMVAMGRWVKVAMGSGGSSVGQPAVGSSGQTMRWSGSGGRTMVAVVEHQWLNAMGRPSRKQTAVEGRSGRSAGELEESGRRRLAKDFVAAELSVAKRVQRNGSRDRAVEALTEGEIARMVPERASWYEANANEWVTLRDRLERLEHRDYRDGMAIQP